MFESTSLPLRAAIASLLGSCFGIALILFTHSAKAQAPDPEVARAEQRDTTTLRLFGGRRPTARLGWEAQIVRFGDEHGSSIGLIAEKRPWLVGASAVCTLAGPYNLTGYGKVGAQALRSRYRDALGSPAPDSGTELGLGAGVRWQFAPKSLAQFELETIGGGIGNVLSLGLQLRY